MTPSTLKLWKNLPDSWEKTEHKLPGEILIFQVSDIQDKKYIINALRKARSHSEGLKCPFSPDIKTEAKKILEGILVNGLIFIQQKM